MNRDVQQNQWTHSKASFHQPNLLLRSYVVVVRNLLHKDLRTVVARSRDKPLNLEVLELERGTMETLKNPETLEDFLEVNAGEKLSTKSSSLKLYSF